MGLKSANDINLFEIVNRYQLEKTAKKRIRKLVNESKSKDKVDVALDYAHSATKSQLRGTK